MMRILQGLLLLLCLALFTTSASAECAWVLWSDASLQSGEQWGVIGAYSQDEGGKTKCSAAADEENKRIVGTAAAKFRLFLCLLDTIDPRGPKGGR